MENTQQTQTIVEGKLLKKIRIKGTITAITGLHIGGNNASISIGGADATVVRNPLTNEPYIPGSTLKGKMRSLLERLEGAFTKSGITLFGPYMPQKDESTNKAYIWQIFGTTPEEIKKSNKSEQPVSRLIVRDAPLTDESKEDLKNTATDMPFTEVKTEVVIDRITAKATPRQMERVPAGAVFNLELILNIYEGDDEKTFIDKLFMGLALVQNDYLGGKGTRGSGEIKIVVEKISQKTKKDYEDNNDWQELKSIKIPDILNA